MVLRDELLKEHSKKQCEHIVQWVGKSQARFDELFALFMHNENLVVQRAAWPLSYCVIAHPKLIEEHTGALIKNLKKPGLSGAVKRNSVRLLQSVPIPEDFEGLIMDICFKYIQTPSEPPAVKAFSLTILENLSRKYPEIFPELELLIKDRYENESAAFKSRAKKILEKR